MTPADCKRLAEEYVGWLRRGLSSQAVGEACELTTPFLDRHNDHLQIYLTQANGGLTLSDDGYVLADLRASGLDIDTPKRRAVLEGVLRGLGVQEERGALTVRATPANAAQRMHALVQAMLAVNDMFVMAQPRVASFFFEDVRGFLDANGVRYIERPKLAGRSGFDHAVDFVVAKSSTRPERLVEAINAPNKNTISAYLWTLSDLREARAAGSQPPEAFAFLNDQQAPVSGEITEALAAYGVIPAIWSQRAQYAEALAT